MSKSQVPSLQLDLFHPVPTRPHWRTLPLDVRGRVLELLVQLIQASSLHGDHSHDGHATDCRQEVGDE